MKRLKYIIPLLLAGWFLTTHTACKKVLELESKETPSSNKFWKNQGDALAGLLGGYSMLRDALTDENRYYVYGDVPANTFRITYYSDYSIHQLREGSFDGVYYGYLENLQNWTKFYKAIAQTNLLIQKIPDIPEATFTAGYKDYFLGESYFLRAFNYFYISRVWGDVPLVLKAVEDVEEAENYGREKQQVVLTKCLEDLDSAIALLPQLPINSSDRGVRATKASALALQAHVYAWMKNYTKCEEVTRDLVANPGNYGLTFITDSAQYARLTIGRSTEGIFEININYEQNESSDEGIGQKTLYAPYLATREPGSDLEKVPWLVLRETMMKLFDNPDDMRQKIWIYQDPVGPEMLMLRKYANVYYRDGDERKDPRYSNNIIINRLSDVMLLRAEALYMTGDEGGTRTLMNKTRNRAGIGDIDPAITGDDLLVELVYERQRELFAEGHAFWDLIRTGKINEFNSVFNGAMEPGNPSYGRNYWPIPRALFKDNLLMKQTPYWNGRL